MNIWLHVLPVLGCLFYPSCTLALPSSHVLGPQAVNLWKLQHLQHGTNRSQGPFVQSEALAGTQPSEFEAQWFRQPLDHFSHKTTHDTFLQRYWVNDRHYNASVGGPVIVLDGGETSGENRLPFLDTGIVNILAKATGGLGVVLEHRYYGASIAVKNLTTDSLRFLDNEQAAADSANFMQNVKFAGIDRDLTAPKTPWIYYGGSYAGARAAHMKILYPDIVFGAIASSGVTHAAIIMWEYFDVIRKAADPVCSAHIQNTVKTVDGILSRHIFTRALKSLFGLQGLSHDEDFVSVLQFPLGTWQNRCWDPAVCSLAWENFCEALSQPPVGAVAGLADLPYEHPARIVQVAGGLAVDFTILNYAKYIKANVVTQCPEGSTQEKCFGTFDDDLYLADTLDQTWRLWQFQVCTQWGYWAVAPLDPTYPRIVSKLITVEYVSKICKQAYPPGDHFTVPALPNVTAVNALGDYDIAADRLAIIDGELDPWRPETPHSQYARRRKDTLLRPFKLIPNAVHHWDEWGLENLEDEPAEIRKIHGQMIAFVLEWLKDWKY